MIYLHGVYWFQHLGMVCSLGLILLLLWLVWHSMLMEYLVVVYTFQSTNNFIWDKAMNGGGWAFSYKPWNGHKNPIPVMCGTHWNIVEWNIFDWFRGRLTLVWTWFSEKNIISTSWSDIIKPFDDIKTDSRFMAKRGLRCQLISLIF